MESPKTNNVIQFGRHDIEALANATRESRTAQPEVAHQRPERSGVLGLAVGLGVAGLLAVGFAPRGDKAPAPVPESFSDQVQESAQQPYNPETDEVIIDGIRIKPGNSHKNTPSEAVLSNSEVKTYIANNPSEASSLETSSLSLPSDENGEYVVVKRDVDHDGDADAVAVPR